MNPHQQMAFAMINLQTTSNALTAVAKAGKQVKLLLAAVLGLLLCNVLSFVSIFMLLAARP